MISGSTAIASIVGGGEGTNSDPHPPIPVPEREEFGETTEELNRRITADLGEKYNYSQAKAWVKENVPCIFKQRPTILAPGRATDYLFITIYFYCMFWYSRWVWGDNLSTTENDSKKIKKSMKHNFPQAMKKLGIWYYLPLYTIAVFLSTFVLVWCCIYFVVYSFPRIYWWRQIKLFAAQSFWLVAIVYELSAPEDFNLSNIKMLGVILLGEIVILLGLYIMCKPFSEGFLVTDYRADLLKSVPIATALLYPLVDLTGTFIGWVGGSKLCWYDCGYDQYFMPHWLYLYLAPEFMLDPYLMWWLYTGRDILLWVIAYELAYYSQHRVMHDIGATLHETYCKFWLTFTSMYVPLVFFPIKIWTFRFTSLLYVFFQVFKHYDLCISTRYYGCHLPVWDVVFGTYQRGTRKLISKPFKWGYDSEDYINNLDWSSWRPFFWILSAAFVGSIIVAEFDNFDWKTPAWVLEWFPEWALKLGLSGWDCRDPGAHPRVARRREPKISEPIIRDVPLDSLPKNWRDIKLGDLPKEKIPEGFEGFDPMSHFNTPQEYEFGGDEL